RELHDGLKRIIALEDYYIDTRGCSRETARGYAITALEARLRFPRHNHEARKAEAQRDELLEACKGLLRAYAWEATLDHPNAKLHLQSDVFKALTAIANTERKH